MTRVNGIFEVDFNVTMILIANTDAVIYTNPGSDPYTGNLNSQLQSTLTSIIGEANYDVGHLFHEDTDGGNASFDSACGAKYAMSHQAAQHLEEETLGHLAFARQAAAWHGSRGAGAREL